MCANYPNLHPHINFLKTLPDIGRMKEWIFPLSRISGDTINSQTLKLDEAESNYSTPPPASASVYLLICSSDHLLICSSAHLLICLSAHLFISSSAYLLIWPSAHLLISSSAYQLICLSAYLFICSSDHLLICSSAYQLIWLSHHLLREASLKKYSSSFGHCPNSH